MGRKQSKQTNRQKNPLTSNGEKIWTKSALFCCILKVHSTGYKFQIPKKRIEESCR